MPRRKKGESPSEFRSRRNREAYESPLEGFFEGLGVVIDAIGVGLATAAEAEERSERRRIQENLRQEEQRAKDRVISQMAGNFPSSSMFDTRENIETRYIVQRLDEINKRLRDSNLRFMEKTYLQEEKRKLENKLGL